MSKTGCARNGAAAASPMPVRLYVRIELIRDRRGPPEIASGKGRRGVSCATFGRLPYRRKASIVRRIRSALSCLQRVAAGGTHSVWEEIMDAADVLRQQQHDESVIDHVAKS